MALLPIIKLGHPTLRKTAEEIREVTREIRTLADNMIDTMQINDGIGLAGNQVNILKRIFVIDLSVVDESFEPQAYINPKMISSEAPETMEEGCLSIPDVRFDVTRHSQLKVEYLTLDGEQVSQEMDGLTARVFLHELDHLDGILFIDKLSVLQRKMLEPELKKIREEYSII